MYEEVAPSGVRVYSCKPFKKYGFRDRNVVPFALWSWSWTVSKTVKGYWKEWTR